MNIVMKNLTSTNYYLISIWKEADEFIVKTKWLRFNNSKAELLSSTTIDKFKSLREAKRRCRALVKNKECHKGLMEIRFSYLPSSILAHFAPPIDSRMTPEEFLQFIIKTRAERYVTLKENMGMKSFYDLGIQYVGYITDDSYLLDVYDKNGKLRSVSLTRLDNMVKTEDCIEAEKLGR